jgi:molybdenum cofactor synthesis domain-containing protein
MKIYSAAVVTVSDSCVRGEREDRSGVVLRDGLEGAGWKVVRRELVPDEAGEIEDMLRSLDADLIVTTGGTGFAPRDVTPEATARVIERPVPGIPELLRWTGYQKMPRAVLSRGTAGIRGQSLIINLPGSPKAVQEALDVLLPLLPHAIDLLKDAPVDH